MHVANWQVDVGCGACRQLGLVNFVCAGSVLECAAERVRGRRHTRPAYRAETEGKQLTSDIAVEARAAAQRPCCCGVTVICDETCVSAERDSLTSSGVWSDKRCT